MAIPYILTMFDTDILSIDIAANGFISGLYSAYMRNICKKEELICQGKEEALRKWAKGHIE
jgi:hypothetical protein